jgi:small-conductance mechanosensitive channel
MDFKDFLALHINIGSFKLTVSHLLMAVLILLAAKTLIWFLSRTMLDRYFQRRKVDQGRQLALKQFLGYIIWVLAVFAVLELFGISSMIWASSAALLVGIGLGLQDTFKDFISGVIILVEGTVEVGDILEVNGIVARVVHIGLRTSKLETRDRVSILVPNSSLVGNQVTNWTHDDQPTRFAIRVGVAYGSDIQLAKSLLIQAAKTSSKVLPDPAPSVQFRNFGDSSLDLDLLFFSQEFFNIESVKSDIRFEIQRLFQEHGIEIPFPQRDVWIRNELNIAQQKP